MRDKDAIALRGRPWVTVAFSGSRAGMTRPQHIALSTILRMWGTSVLVHGDCIGSDNEADAMAIRLGLSRIIYPSNLEPMRAHCERRGAAVGSAPAPPLDRNRLIPRWADAMVATPRGDSRGTWYTCRFAAAMYKPVIVIGEDGVACQYVKPTQSPLERL